ncbi:MAG: hypothetical protein IKL18_08365 [Oscillospiraceae bacterium]|nr:hypothetical protein [Oscillospiraceae bacterium]MBR6658165.1 hypothetical protein [Oscillospiraceae bacterium]
MKKILAFVLAMIMMLSFAACGNSEPAEGENGGAEVTVGSALEILETVWGEFGEDEKFFAMGGDYDNMVDGAPGTVTNADYISGVLLVPAGTEVIEAAGLVHGMNLNSFTAGAFKVADAAAFAETMHEAIASAQWMCGFPDKMVIATFGSEYVVAAFGINDAINPFEEKLSAVYPEAEIVYSEAIA